MTTVAELEKELDALKKDVVALQKKFGESEKQLRLDVSDELATLREKLEAEDGKAAATVIDETAEGRIARLEAMAGIRAARKEVAEDGADGA